MESSAREDIEFAESVLRGVDFEKKVKVELYTQLAIAKSLDQIAAEIQWRNERELLGR